MTTRYFDKQAQKNGQAQPEVPKEAGPANEFYKKGSSNTPNAVEEKKEELQQQKHKGKGKRGQ